MRVSFFVDKNKIISNVKSVNLVMNNLLILHLHINSEGISTISIKGKCDKPSKFKNETSFDTIYQELLELGYIDLSPFKLLLTNFSEQERIGSIILEE